MLVVAWSSDEVTVCHDGKRFIYRVSKPHQAKEILKKMMPSSAFNWLDKYGTFVTSY